MMAERGVTVSHSTIPRWVQRYVPEFQKRWDRYARPVHSSWRMDETAVPVRGSSHYSTGPSRSTARPSILCCVRIAAGRLPAFFSKGIETHQPRRPRKVNLDGNAASHRALRVLAGLSPSGERPVRARESRVALSRGTQPPVSQQHRRAGPSSDQTPLGADAWLEVLSHRSRYACRSGTRASHSQAPILVRSRRPAPVFVS